MDGVISFFPKLQRDQFLADLLETRVESYRIDEKTGRWDIRVEITELPEIKAKLQSSDVLPVIGAWSTPDFAEASRGFRMNVHDLTLRELLNQIIRTSDMKRWTIRRYGDRFHYLGLNF